MSKTLTVLNVDTGNEAWRTLLAIISKLGRMSSKWVVSLLQIYLSLSLCFLSISLALSHKNGGTAFVVGVMTDNKRASSAACCALYHMTKPDSSLSSFLNKTHTLKHTRTPSHTHPHIPSHTHTKTCIKLYQDTVSGRAAWIEHRKHDYEPTVLYG